MHTAGRNGETMTDQRTNGRILADPADASTGDLVKLAAEQISRLVRDELQLARVEIGGKAKRFGTGAGLFGAAGVIALYGVATLVATVILLLALVLPAWAAALILAAVPPAPPGAMAPGGRRQFRAASPATPRPTPDPGQADPHR